MKTPSERTLLKIFAELEKGAYDKEYHTYDYKRTNQIIRANIEAMFVAKNISINPPVSGRSEQFPCKHRSYRAGHSPSVPYICNNCGEEL